MVSKTYKTSSWEWELDDRDLVITNNYDGQRYRFNKREFAQALVGLGITHIALVQYQDEQKENQSVYRAEDVKEIIGLDKKEN